MKSNILIVDDEPHIRMLLKQMLSRREYVCDTAADVAEARERIRQFDYALVMTDINMPGESGLEFARFLAKEHPEIAVIMVTAIDDTHVAEAILRIGVYDYIAKPIDKNRVLISVSGALQRAELEKRNLDYRCRLEKMVAEKTRTLEETMGKLSRSLDGTVKTLSHVVEVRDPYTAGHQRRVARLSCAIAENLGMPADRVAGLFMAGLIHDLGKIAVPSEILSKPTRLSAIEYQLIQTHPKVGFDVLDPIEFPWPVAQVAYQHHERMDGSGYPRGLKGDEILEEARILAVADVVEAMATHRPYRPALGVEAALEEISMKKGSVYDERVVEACVAVVQGGNFELVSLSN